MIQISIFKKLRVLLVCLLLLSGAGTAVFAQSAANIPKKKVKKVLYGQASFYADKFNGRKTASGEIFSQKKFTAACNSLPLGTWVRVTNLRNNRVVLVKVNDRLHTKTRRLLDLTKAGAQQLKFISSGLTRIKVEVLGKKRP